MKTTGILRVAYRAIVRCHPADFRERFGEEMVWIFDEESGRGRAGRALADGVVSLVRQRTRGEEDFVAVAAGFGLLPAGLRTGPRRMVQGGFTVAILFAAALVLMGPRGGWWFNCQPAVPERPKPALYAPTRIEPLGGTLEARAGVQPVRHPTLYYRGMERVGWPCYQAAATRVR